MPLEVVIEGDSLAAINRKIYEIKKKIQLSEGQRKAQYEECVDSKKKNVQKIRQLKKDVRALHETLGQPPDRSELITKTAARYPRDACTLRSKNNQEAVQFIDNKAFDLRKKLDLLRYREQWFENKLNRLGKEKEDLEQQVALNHMKKRDKDAEEKICSLENQIHHVEMNIMEAVHVNKKYRAIRTSLLEDGVEFESSLEKLEQSIEKQEEEIKKLNDVHKEALSLRDVTKGILVRQEENAMHRGKVRDRQLAECRALVEERRLDLERLERHIFPTGRPLLHQDSDSDSESKQTSAEEAVSAKTVETLEAAFTILKEATGVTEFEEVLGRFLSQIETQSRLGYLKGIAEDEKSALEARQSSMLAELEAFKFAETKDKEQNVEENERVKKWIDEQTLLREKYSAETDQIIAQTSEIKNFIFAFLKELEHADDTPVPKETSDSSKMAEVLEMLNNKIQAAMDQVGDEPELEPLEEIDDGQTSPLPVLPEDVWTFPKQLAEPSGGGDTSRPPPPPLPESDDDDEVPTRGFLKRQAQIIIDAKSRRKQFTVTRRGRSGFGK